MKFLPVTPDRWPDLEQLFEGPGGPNHCWCMLFRHMKPANDCADLPPAKVAMFRLVARGISVGILGYVDREPVAWCSIAPLETHQNLPGQGPLGDSSDTEGVWSLPCFFVRSDFRRQGLTRQLITAAINYAEDHGAKSIEAYPIVQDSPGNRFMGFVSTFEANGFKKVRTLDTLRIMMRLHL